jgi:coproporphyrinogen III oxidase-like Fe-S oxidoreductase
MATDDLSERLGLVGRSLALSPEPLHVPLGLLFRPMDGASHMRAWTEHAARAARGGTFAPATLYVHVPFCARVCTYCLLSAVRTPGKEAVEAYLGAMRRQIALYEPVVRGLRFGSLHIGGGTPTLLDERQLDSLLTELSRLPLSEHAQIGVEAHPGTSTPGRLAVLRRHGVHRVSFGVESLTPEVLRKVNREDQNETRVRSAVEEARRLGFSVNVDLLAGLPGETESSWEETVKKTLELEPDSLSVNRFLGENSLLARFGFGPDDEENRRVDAMLLRADATIRERSRPRWPEEPLETPGFGTQYVWDRSSSARPYFQDDMIGPVSTLAIGHGALGHVYASHFSVTAGAQADYVASLARGEPPGMQACALDERFEMTFFAAEQACRGSLSLKTFQQVFRRPFDDAFERELRFLIQQGLLRVDGDRVSKPPRLDFQMAHLLAFLLLDAPALAGQIRVLDTRPIEHDSGAVEPVRLRGPADVDALLERESDPAGMLRIDVGQGLDGESTTRLALAAAAGKGPALEVRDDGRRPLRQYESLRTEMPPSMLWVRIAIRAAQAGRGEQRLAIAPVQAHLEHDPTTNVLALRPEPGGDSVTGGHPPPGHAP